MSDTDLLLGTPDKRQFDTMLASATEACDKRLRALVEATSDLPKSVKKEIFGKECEEMMRESLPPIDTPTTTENALPRAITISRVSLV